MILQLFRFGRFMHLIRHGPGRFAIMFTIGNLLALGSTFFLAGPRRQYKKMRKSGRWVSSLLYVSAMFITLVVAFCPFFHGQGLVIVVMVIVQWCTLVWYVLSYVPLAQQTCRRWFQSRMSMVAGA